MPMEARCDERKPGSPSTSVASVDSFSSLGGSSSGSVASSVESSAASGSEYASASGSFRDNSSVTGSTTSNASNSGIVRRAASREKDAVDGSNLTVQALKEMTRMRLKRQQCQLPPDSHVGNSTSTLPQWQRQTNQSNSRQGNMKMLERQGLEQFVAATKLAMPRDTLKVVDNVASRAQDQQQISEKMMPLNTEVPAFVISSSIEPEKKIKAHSSQSSATCFPVSSSRTRDLSLMHRRPRPPALSAVTRIDKFDNRTSPGSPVESISFSVAEYVLTSPRGSESSPTALGADRIEDFDESRAFDNETDISGVIDFQTADTTSTPSGQATRTMTPYPGSGRGADDASGTKHSANKVSRGTEGGRPDFLRTDSRGSNGSRGSTGSIGSKVGSGGGGRPDFLRTDSLGSNGSRGSTGSAGSKASTSSSVSSPRSPRTPTLTVDMSPLAQKLYDLSQLYKRGKISSAEKKKLKREVIRLSSSEERRNYLSNQLSIASATVANSFFS